MELKITVRYDTKWGEALDVRFAAKSCPMDCVSPGLWEARISGADVSKMREFHFEVRSGGEVVRKEWGTHKILVPTLGSPREFDVRAAWLDRPADSPFYSSLFTEVVFRRGVTRSQHKSDFMTGGGNVTFIARAAQIRPDECLAITGSGPLFGDWQRVVPLNDVRFPVWDLTLNVQEDFEYKYLIIDRKSRAIRQWEEGGNHLFSGVPEGRSRRVVVADVLPRFSVKAWRGAGTAVPVFSLRSEDSFGVGEFLDIKKLVDWAHDTGQNVIQLLPINDTTMTGTWKDSYPYNAVSTFALHPQYINLPAAGLRVNKEYKQLRQELNALETVDYERVNNEKRRLLRAWFRGEGQKVVAGAAFRKFCKDNEAWLKPYAAFCVLRDENGTPDFHQWGKYAVYSPSRVSYYMKKNIFDVEFYAFEQYVLDAQLREVVAYAHSRGVALKGDIPIGISPTSVDAWVSPSLFHTDSQAGAPPDAFSTMGQNWGFPTYNWDRMAADGFSWWKARLRKMSEYFDAYRIDHILGFFRIWEIPVSCVHGLLGHFNPALPYSAAELGALGFDMGGGRWSTPIVEDWVLREVFGDRAGEVQRKYIWRGRLAPAVDTQRKVLDRLVGDDEDTKTLRDGLLGLLDDVLFVPDPHRKGWYHPRIAAQYTLQYRTLDDRQRDNFNRLYNDFFYHRHNEFWRESAMRKLPELIDSTAMLTCGEDLGMIPGCVPQTMRQLNILSLEIQRMPKSPEKVFDDPATYPYLAVCATGTHDTSTLRAWWEEDREATTRFWHDVLHAEGEVPYFCEPWVCKMIIDQHLHSPAMLTVLPLQDWLSIDGKLRWQGNPADERINVPAIPRHYWRWRMHCTLEKLISSRTFAKKLHDAVRASGRGE